MKTKQNQKPKQTNPTSREISATDLRAHGESTKTIDTQFECMCNEITHQRFHLLLCFFFAARAFFPFFFFFFFISISFSLSFRRHVIERVDRATARHLSCSLCAPHCSVRRGDIPEDEGRKSSGRRRGRHRSVQCRRRGKSDAMATLRVRCTVQCGGMRGGSMQCESLTVTLLVAFLSPLCAQAASC